jgi:hypothetical protein
MTGMTGHSELELAIAHLLRAKELAEFFHWPEEQQKRIDLLFRGACDLKRQLSQQLYTTKTAYQQDIHKIQNEAGLDR